MNNNTERKIWNSATRCQSRMKRRKFKSHLVCYVNKFRVASKFEENDLRQVISIKMWFRFHESFLSFLKEINICFWIFNFFLSSKPVRWKREDKSIEFLPFSVASAVDLKWLKPICVYGATSKAFPQINQPNLHRPFVRQNNYWASCLLFYPNWESCRLTPDYRLKGQEVEPNQHSLSLLKIPTSCWNEIARNAFDKLESFVYFRFISAHKIKCIIGWTVCIMFQVFVCKNGHRIITASDSNESRVNLMCLRFLPWRSVGADWVVWTRHHSCLWIRAR